MFKIRELEKKDLPEINKWRNDPELISFLGAPFRYINLRVDEEWFENYMRTRSSNVRCSIVDENDEILGLISLTGIDPVNRSGELHLMIGNKENRNKGIGSFAVDEMLHHAFCNLNLNRVELCSVITNDISPKLYIKKGFQKEGMKRQAVFKDGKYLDMYFYSLLKEEYMEMHGNE